MALTVGEPASEASFTRGTAEDWADAYLRAGGGPKLWHYTTHPSFVSILSSLSIRATAIQFLNDKREFEYALDLLTAKVVPERMKATTDATERAFLEFLSRNSRAGTSGALVFVFSLSVDSDDLSQWRAYCPEGNGLAMGFETRRLQYWANRAGFRLLECVYQEIAQKALLLSDLNSALKVAASASGGIQQKIDAGVTELRAKIPLTASRLKHQAFEDEQEWRLVSQNATEMPPFPVGEEVAFRATSIGPIPYRTISFDPKALPAGLHGDLSWPMPSVTIGPSVDPDLSLSNVHLMILSQAPMLRHVLRITPSKLPFRPRF